MDDKTFWKTTLRVLLALFEVHKQFNPDKFEVENNKTENRVYIDQVL